eukprot:1333120-Pyramimonas_sp.AAC.1
MNIIFVLQPLSRNNVFVGCDSKPCILGAVTSPWPHRASAISELQLSRGAAAWPSPAVDPPGRAGARWASFEVRGGDPRH